MTVSGTRKPVVWITGAGKGIGAAIARRLAREGCRLALSGRSEEALAQVAGACAAASGLMSIACDVRKEEDVVRAHAAIVSELGAVDVLIANAGVGTFKPLPELDVAELDAMLATNVRGVFLCAKQVVPAMIENRSGTILTIHSIAAITAFPGCTAYGASKAASLALCRSLRAEVREHGVKVIDILPGATETDIWAPEARAEFRERMMLPEDVAEVVAQALQAPDRSMVEEIVLRPQRGDL